MLASQALAGCSARAMLARWTIGNGVHWVLGVGFDEDRARNRKDHGPENLAVLRKRKRCGWSDPFARSFLGQRR